MRLYSLLVTFSLSHLRNDLIILRFRPDLGIEGSQETQNNSHSNDEISRRVEFLEREAVSHVPEKMSDTIYKMIPNSSCYHYFHRVKCPLRESTVNPLQGLSPVCVTCEARLHSPSIQQDTQTKTSCSMSNGQH